MKDILGRPSMRALPLPCRTTRASSFAPVVCQPTDSPDLSRTKPLRIPEVCGTPFKMGQSPCAQSRGRTNGCGEADCDDTAIAAASNGNAEHKATVSFI